MNFIKSIFLFFKLNLAKLVIYPRFRSAKDSDRLKFEWELCRLAVTNQKVLFVGVHERSFVYELVLPFSFIDITDDYLVKAKSDIYHDSCVNVNEDYDILILAGVLNYGTDIDLFKQILSKTNFKKFLIQDWKKNRESHALWINTETRIVNLNLLFYYYFDGK